jgi:hypothetical protein
MKALRSLFLFFPPTLLSAITFAQGFSAKHDPSLSIDRGNERAVSNRFASKVERARAHILAESLVATLEETPVDQTMRQRFFVVDGEAVAAIFDVEKPNSGFFLVVKGGVFKVTTTDDELRIERERSLETELHEVGANIGSSVTDDASKEGEESDPDPIVVTGRREIEVPGPHDLFQDPYSPGELGAGSGNPNPTPREACLKACKKSRDALNTKCKVLKTPLARSVCFGAAATIYAECTSTCPN